MVKVKIIIYVIAHCESIMFNAKRTMNNEQVKKLNISE
jgi:hypothetical protein